MPDVPPRLLFLAHRIPYPPNKGDKIRSFHLLRHLAARYRVRLGAFVDDPADLRHRATLERWCEEVHLVPIAPRARRLLSLAALAGGEALSVRYYRDARMARWVESVLASDPLAGVLAFSSPMSQYVPGEGRDLTRVADFVDVDSEKWRQYAGSERWPLDRLYRREAAALLAFERAVAGRFERTLFVSEAEAALFRARSGASDETAVGGRIEVVRNGVDAAFFSPEHAFASPFVPGELPLVFTGAMDYRANADAVRWFALEVLPGIRRRHPRAVLYVVGARPGRAVRRLAGRGGVRVTGAVPDVRPYLAHARAAVAPLRVARGVQNKVLEAMAMEQPVLGTPAAMEGLGAGGLLTRYVAAGADDLVERGAAVLHDDLARQVGRAGRRFVLERFAWERTLAGLEGLFAPPADPAQAAAWPAVCDGGVRT